MTSTARQRTSQQKGKLAEFLVFRELVKRGADLYLPVIDAGIDAIIRQEDGTHLDMQVKATEEGWSPTVWVPDDPQLRQRLVIVWVDMTESQENPEVWIFPGDIFVEYSTKIGEWQNSQGQPGTHRRLILYQKRRGDDQPRRELLKECRNAWKLLTG